MQPVTAAESTAPSTEPTDLVPLAEIAAELKIPAGSVWQLTALSRRGKFPPLLKITRKRYLVSRSAVEAWKAGRWTQPPAGAAPVQQPPAAAPKARRRRRTAR